MANPDWRPENHRRRSPELGTEKRRMVAILAGSLLLPVGIVALTYGLVGWLPMHLMAGCPPRGHTVALIVARTSDTDSGSSTEAHYAVFDARSGAPLGHRELEESGDASGRTFCARADDSRNWVVGSDSRPQIFAGAAPELLVPWETLARAAGIASAPSSVGWDAEADTLVVNTRDGFAIALDPATLAGRRVAGTPSLFTLGGFHDEVVPPGVVEYYVGGRDELRLADGTPLELAGHPRARLLREGRALLGGSDFLMPSFLLHPGTRSIEWPDPRSVVVVEETETGSRIYRIARIALDGTVLFRFTPSTATPPAWRYRPVPYAAYDQGRVIVLFEENGMRGLDGRSGVDRWQTAYRDDG